MVIGGGKLYVAAFGSGKIRALDTQELEHDTFVPSASSHIAVTGGGPSGLALADGRLYVMTRFDNAISVIDTTTRHEIQHTKLFNPEPPSVVDGGRSSTTPRTRPRTATPVCELPCLRRSGRPCMGPW